MRSIPARLEALGQKPWYPTFAMFVVAVSFVASLFSSLGVLALTLADRQQAQQRESDRAAQLQCIDDRDAFAAEASQVLRDVTQHRDDLSQARGRATIAKERALVKWTGVLLSAPLDGSGDPALIRKFLKATTELNAAAGRLQDTERALRDANRDLKQARKDNPVVPPASEVCASGVFVPPAPDKS